MHAEQQDARVSKTLHEAETYKRLLLESLNAALERTVYITEGAAECFTHLYNPSLVWGFVFTYENIQPNSTVDAFLLKDPLAFAVYVLNESPLALRISSSRSTHCALEE